MRPLKAFCLFQLQEFLSGLVEVHGKVEPSNQVTCYNYVLFAPENSQNFGKLL